MISKTSLRKIAQYIKYDRIYGPWDKPSAITVEKYQKCEEVTIKRYWILYQVMQEDIENADFKQKMADYQREIKSFKDKLKEIEKKKRKR